jgi:hypothetical protein
MKSNDAASLSTGVQIRAPHLAAMDFCRRIDFTESSASGHDPLSPRTYNYIITCGTAG